MQRIEEADNKGETKAIHRGLKAISGLSKKGSDTKPTLNNSGKRINSPQELDSVWKEFLDRKFEPTELEQLRAEFEALPEC